MSENKQEQGPGQRSGGRREPLRGTETAVFLRSPDGDEEEFEPIPIAFRDRSVIETVPIAIWEIVLSAAGLEPTDLSVEALAERLDAPVPSTLADAIATLATVDAETAIAGLFDLEGSAGSTLPEDWNWDAPAQEQLMRLWVMAQTDHEVATRLSILKATALPTPRPQKVFAGREARAARWSDAKATALKCELRDKFSRRGLGEYIEVLATQDRDQLVYYVIRSTRCQSVVRVNKEQTGRAPFVFRKAVCDTLVYHALTGRLELRVGAAALVDIYRHSLAKVLFDDSSFFDGAGGWTLEPVQRRGRDLLRIPAHEAEVIEVDLRACVWTPDHDHRFAITSRTNAFDAAEAQGIDLSQGELTEAKFSFRFSSGGRRNRATATVRPPNQLTCAEFNRPRVERYLRSIGVFAPELEAGFDLWSVASKAHPAVAWAAALGCAATDVDHVGYLVPTKLVELPSRRSPGDRLRLLDYEASSEVVVGSTDDAVLEVHPTAETNGFRLDLDLLVEALAKDLGLNGCGRTRVVGIVDLGRRPVDGGQLRVFLAHASPGAAGSELRQALRLEGDERAVLVMPRTCELATDLATVCFEHLVPPTTLLQQIAVELDIESCIDARQRAPHGMRLVLDSHQDRAWLDGVDLGVTSGEYTFLEKIAGDRIFDRVTTTVRLEESGAISGSARKTKSKVVARFKQALVRLGSKTNAKIEAGKLITSRGSNRGYKLCIPAWIG